MTADLFFLVPVPPLAFILMMLFARWYSRNFENEDILSAESSERRAETQDEDLKNFQLACPTSPGSEETCIICLEQIHGADPSCKLQCKHEFHPECLFAWWKRSKALRYEGVGRQDPVVRCPTCRQKHKRQEVEKLGDEEMVHEAVWMTWQGFWTHSIATSGILPWFDANLAAKILYSSNCQNIAVMSL